MTSTRSRSASRTRSPCWRSGAPPCSRHAAVSHVDAALSQVRECKFYADGGTTATQQRVRLYPSVTAVAVTDDGRFDTMRTLAPPAGRGCEYLTGTGWDWDAELAELPELLAAKLTAPSVQAGYYDVVIDPSNLWLTIHESIGHATELDRALGYEAAYAGTSFATLGQARQPALRLAHHARHRRPHRRERPGHRRLRRRGRGRPVLGPGQQRHPDRLSARPADGAAQAASGAPTAARSPTRPSHIRFSGWRTCRCSPAADGPSTEDLISGVEDGIYIVGDKCWSIDMQRYNFQFTGQRFFRIRDGQLAGQLRDVAYQATTTDFWGVDGGRRRAADLRAGRRVQLRQGPARPGRPGQPRLPGRAVPRR